MAAVATIKNLSTGESKPIPVDIFPRQLRPKASEWVSNPYWKAAGYPEEEVIGRYKDRSRLFKGDAEKLAHYILVFTQHLTCIYWLSADDDNKDDVVESWAPLIKELKVIEKTTTNRQHIEKMEKLVAGRMVNPIWGV